VNDCFQLSPIDRPGINNGFVRKLPVPTTVIPVSESEEFPAGCIMAFALPE
jgi:hypothetical protein